MKDANAAVNTTVKMALKIQALNGIRTHNLCVSGAMLNQLSNQNHMGAVVSEFGHFMFSGHNTRLKYINSMEIDVQQQQFNYQIMNDGTCHGCIRIFLYFMIKLLLLDIYYHGIHILQPSITSTEHKGPDPDTTALMWL